MAITFVASANSSADGVSSAWSGTANTPVSIPLPTGLANNDLLLVIATYTGTNANHNIYVVETGGQTWSCGTYFATSQASCIQAVAACIFNGTWTATANMAVRDLVSTTIPFTLHSLAFRPTDSNHKIVIDAPINRLLSAAPSGAGPFTYAFNNGFLVDRTPFRSNNMTWAAVSFAVDTTTSGFTAGWSTAFDNHTNIAGSDITTSIKYKIQTGSTAATGNVSINSDQDINRGMLILGTVSEVISSTLNSTGTGSRLFAGPGLAGSGADAFNVHGTAGEQFPSNVGSRVQFADVVPTNDATISLWVYFNYLDGTQDHRLFTRLRSNANSFSAASGTRGMLQVRDFSWMMGLTSGATAQNRLRIRWNNSESATLACNSTLSTGQWYHLCSTFVRSTGTGIGYVNGTNDGSLATFANTAWDTGNTHTVTVGNNGLHDDGTLFNNAAFCYISQPVLWGAALSADEVAALSNGASPLQIEPENLLFYVPDFGRNNTDVDIIGGKTATQVATTPSRFAPPKFKRKTTASYRSPGQVLI